MIKKFQAPDYSQFHLFESEHGKLRTIKVDFKEINKLQKEWEGENPPPDPPLVPVTPEGKFWNVGLARRAKQLWRKHRGALTIEEVEQMVADEQEPRPDPKSPEYKKTYNAWAWRRYVNVERLLLLKGVMYDVGDTYMTLQHIIHEDVNGSLIEAYLKSRALQIVVKLLNTENRVSLYQHFLKISQLTWELVLDKGDELGINWKGRPVLRQIPETHGETQNIIGVGKMAAKSIGVAPGTFDKMTIDEQAEILAVHMCEIWLAKFQQDERRMLQNAQNNR